MYNVMTILLLKRSQPSSWALDRLPNRSNLAWPAFLLFFLAQGTNIVFAGHPEQNGYVHVDADNSTTLIVMDRDQSFWPAGRTLIRRIYIHYLNFTVEARHVGYQLA